MRYLLFFIVAIGFSGCNFQKNETLKTQPFTNDLIHESSPYLLQHAHNPVDWKPYSPSTLELAKREKKLMIISVGYAACHWCHVMEHESFEDSTVAEVMNKHFISVKVDREERPDVDMTYINAVQLMTGHGGWPLNVITLPDGRPVWGGTYFTKENWISALEQIQGIYEGEPQKLISYANRLEEGLKNMDWVQLNSDDIDIKEYPTDSAVKKMAQNFDYEHGGTKGAPKFMMPNNLEFLLRHSFEKNNKEILDFVILTLDKMAFGGLYDQLGGGFARYSVDERWHVPHFEKMLYDNAQLVSLYSNGYAATQKPLYKQIVRETLAFVKRELTNSEGGFYSSLDADSENENGKLEEGAYYVFTSEELRKLLKDDFDIFKEYYNINTYGHWENNQYVLIRKKTDLQIEKEFEISNETLQRKKENWKNILLSHRNKRAKPRLDDKTLTSWNAMMLKGHLDAYKVFGDQEYLDSALQNAQFISEKQLQENGRLYRNYKDGKSNINGFLEDYAFAIEAFIDLYQITMDEKWLNLSKKMTDFTITNFFDAENHMFYFTSKEDPAIVTRNIEYHDNVIPASNSVMAKNLFKLSKYFETTGFEKISHQMLKNILKEIEVYPRGFSNWLNLLSNYQNDFYEVVVVGKDASEKISELTKKYFPNIIIAGNTKDDNQSLFKNRYVEGETLFYICINNVCQMPLTDIETVFRTLNNKL